MTQETLSGFQRSIQNMNSYITKNDGDIKVLKAMYDKITEDKNKLVAQSESLVKENDILNKVILLFGSSSSASRDAAKHHFEKIVTGALQYITQSSDYEFVIAEETTPKGKPAYEFYVKSTVNGVESLQRPEDANGGGFVDIISVSLKYAYLEIFSDPKTKNMTLIYDEPGKMISEEMSIKFAEYIKMLGNHYGRQTIMVTHNNNIAAVADKTLMVKRNSAGISKVSEMDLKELSEIIKEEI